MAFFQAIRFLKLCGILCKTMKMTQLYTLHKKETPVSPAFLCT
jgi:hypothetical protein